MPARVLLVLEGIGHICVDLSRRHGLSLICADLDRSVAAYQHCGGVDASGNQQIAQTLCESVTSKFLLAQRELRE